MYVAASRQQMMGSVVVGTVRPTLAYMESRLAASVNGSCARLQDRIIESFIAFVDGLMTSHGACQSPHRCRIRNTFVYCSSDDDVDPPPSSDGRPENLTVDFVLEAELIATSRPATQIDQRALVHGMDDLYLVLFEMVSDGQFAWWSAGSRLAAVSLDSALVQFEMDNCSAGGQILNDRNPDTPTCREWSEVS